MKALPKFLKPYFWDVDFAELDYKKYPRFVLGRILEYGDKRAINWPIWEGAVPALYNWVIGFPLI